MTSGASGGKQGRDRRAAPRFEFMAQIRIAHGEVNHILDVGNISTTGIFIALDSSEPMPWFRVGLEIVMDLFASDELDNLHLKARIVRMVKDNIGVCGFGAQFIDVDDQTKATLVHIVEQIIATEVHVPPLPGSPKNG